MNSLCTLYYLSISIWEASCADIWSLNANSTLFMADSFNTGYITLSETNFDFDAQQICNDWNGQYYFSEPTLPLSVSGNTIRQLKYVKSLKKKKHTSKNNHN